MSQGTTKLPRSTKLIKKTYFYIASENGYDKRFRKEVFMRNEEGSPVLIHYIGDDSISKPAPHGNCLKQTKLFFRTKPSAIREFESKVQKEQAHKVYKEEISKQTGRDEMLSRPRNVKQLQNLKSKLSGQSRLSRDAILNTHTIAYEEPNFVWKLTTVPDLLVICGMEAMLDELKQLLKKPNPSQMLSYDTTFCLGDFYVSPLLCCVSENTGHWIVPSRLSRVFSLKTRDSPVPAVCLKIRDIGLSRPGCPVFSTRKHGTGQSNVPSRLCV